MVSFIEAEREPGKPLMLHQLEKACFREPFGALRIEFPPPVLDGIGTVERKPLAGFQCDARHWDAAHPFYRIVYERYDPWHLQASVFRKIGSPHAGEQPFNAGTAVLRNRHIDDFGAADEVLLRDIAHTNAGGEAAIGGIVPIAPIMK